MPDYGLVFDRVVEMGDLSIKTVYCTIIQADNEVGAINLFIDQSLTVKLYQGFIKKYFHYLYSCTDKAPIGLQEKIAQCKTEEDYQNFVHENRDIILNILQEACALQIHLKVFDRDTDSNDTDSEDSDSNEEEQDKNEPAEMEDVFD